ncbi:MAG: GTP-binding protein [Candidatus Heimdallarchaeota archaeon]
MRQVEKIALLMENQKNIRNVVLVAHIDHGKTTLSDSLLASGGILAPSTAGEARALDFLPEEQRRGITMKTANISLIFKHENEDYLVNLIDSPGHVDFSGKVARALRIADGAIVVIDAVEQVMAQTETVIRQCIAEGVKPILFINKIDRLIKELKLSAQQIAERIEIIYNNFNSLVSKFAKGKNLPKWRSSTRDGSVVFGSALHRWAISLPIVKETDITFEKIINIYNKKEEMILEELLPIEKPLIDMIIDHLPNPIDAQKYRIQKIWHGDITSTVGKAMVECKASGEDTPLIFCTTKTLRDQHAGSLVLGRIFSGVLTEKTEVFLINSNTKVKIQNAYVFMGSDKKRINNIPAGNTVAVSGLGTVHPGETIANISSEKLVPFEDIEYLANPVVTIAIEPKMLRDLPALKRALERFDLEDPNLIVTIDEKSGEILLLGLGELHLETVVIDLSEEVACTASSPIVIIAERIKISSKKIISEMFGSKVSLYVQPIDKTQIITEEEGQQISADKQVYVEKFKQYNNEIIISQEMASKLSSEAKENIITGVKDALHTGPISSKPVFGVRVIIQDFTTESGEKYEHTVPLLRNAVWEALRNGKITPQEPIYRIQITTPTTYLGKITSILGKRRGGIVEIRTDHDLLIITGDLPVAESFHIDQDLRSDTEGRAFWQMTFDRYEPIQKNELENF